MADGGKIRAITPCRGGAGWHINGLTSRFIRKAAGAYAEDNAASIVLQGQAAGQRPEPVLRDGEASAAERRRDDPAVGHPNRSRFALGGVVMAVGMNGDHVLGLAGLLAAPFADACRWLAVAQDALGERYAWRVARYAIERHQAACDEIGRRMVAARQDMTPRGRASDGPDAVKYALGVPLYGYGLRYTHAAALPGLGTLGMPAMIERLASVPGRHRTLGGRLLLALEPGFAELDRRGRRSAFNRGAVAYADRCETFATREAVSEDCSWRAAPVTRRQRWTMVDTAIVLGIALPTCRTCGEAADWLEANGAILKYRQGGK